MNGEKRTAHIRKLREIEGEFRKLVDAVFDDLPDALQIRRRVVNDKAEVAIFALEELIYLDVADLSRVRAEMNIADVHDRSDAIISMKANLDRERRRLIRELEDLDMREQRTLRRQVMTEIDIEADR